MKVTETRYFAVANEKNTNFYRLRITARSRLGQAEYRSGWFPERSVDMLFGNAKAEEGARALEVRTALEEQINKKIVEVQGIWLDSAASTAVPDASLEKIRNARSRILGYPDIDPPFPDMFEVEYNPGMGLAIKHSDEKMVFVLSSNPDEIVGAISGFAENEKTVLEINKLKNLLSSQTKEKIMAAQETLRVYRGYDSLLLAPQIEAALKNLESSTDLETARREAQILLNLLNSLK